MKIAAQTVLWGNRIEDLPRALDILAIHGCEGVEFSQRPETLGSPQRLKTMLSDRNLTLLGLSGGTVCERIDYCADVLAPQYLYVEDWNDADAAYAARAGIPLALHPHVFKPVHRLADAEALLNAHKGLLFLPDVVHLTIAGDSPAKALEQWHRRLAAVHVKDWTPIHGRSSHRYARGFVNLGDGIVSFPRIFKQLRDQGYAGWIVFEQGNPESSPEEVISKSTRWLAARRRGLLRRRPVPRRDIEIKMEPAEGCTSNELRIASSYTKHEEQTFLEALFRVATDGPFESYPRLAKAVCELIKARLVILCSCVPASNLMAVIGVYPELVGLGNHFMAYRDSLSSVALERQAVTQFDLSSPRPAEIYGQPNAQFGYPSLVDTIGNKTLISVPVLDPQNPHQARLVVNIFPSSPNSPVDSEDLIRIGRFIARAADSALDERCALAAAGASFAAGRCHQSEAFLNELRDLLLRALDCDALTIFLVNDAENQMEEAVSTGLVWKVTRSEQFYRLGEGIPGTVWERREPLLSPNPEKESLSCGKSHEENSSSRPSLLCAPILDARGDVVGVIRCRHKRSTERTENMFSEDDLAVFDAVCQAAVPHLQVLLSKERRGKALRRFTHELNNPIIALGGAANKMRRELQRRQLRGDEIFSQDYIGDIESWLGLMRGLLGNADVFRLGTDRIILHQKRVQLYADIFMPAVQQIGQLLVDRDFDVRNISIHMFSDIPTLWLDKNRLNQVAFNLLTNAIKYASDIPNRFRVEVSSRWSDEWYQLDFSDWGPGISPEMKDAIFYEGVRSKNAEQSNVSGDGLGLWIVKRVVEAHYGKIELTNFRAPTTFTISFPKWLSESKEPLQPRK